MISVIAIPSGPFHTNAYLVHSNGKAFIVDASKDCTDFIIKLCKRLQVIPTQLILTHSHWDHIADAKRLQDTFHIPIFVHTKDAKNLQIPGSDLIPCPLTIDGVGTAEELYDGQTISLLDDIWQIIHTPGHSPGGICLFSKKNNLLFSGDTLFQGTYGSVSLPTSNAKDMAQSLKKLSYLPDDTLVYPGHGPKTTIAQERHLLNHVDQLLLS